MTDQDPSTSSSPRTSISPEEQEEDESMMYTRYQDEENNEDDIHEHDNNNFYKHRLDELQKELQRLRSVIKEKDQMKRKRQAEPFGIESMGKEEESSRPSSQPSSQKGKTLSNSAARTIHELDMTKELFKLVPNYDGTGGPSKLIDYIEKFQKYSDVTGDDLTSNVELSLATAKLTGDANLWWREHCTNTP